MKISLLTVSYNSALTIEDTIQSVLSQDYPDVEYIVVDGSSTDGTQQIIQSHQNRISKWISEPDHGIYDAMNKAIGMASGDVIGIINSDDFYAHPGVLTKVAETLAKNQVDAVYGDLVFVDPGNLKKIVRHYSSQNWQPGKFAWGFMPAHPTFFVKRSWYAKAGLFKTDYKIAADYEMLIRLLYVHRVSYAYIHENMVVMRRGGVSSNGIKSNIVLNQEILRACRENGISTNYLKIYSKYFRKVFELIGKG